MGILAEILNQPLEQGTSEVQVAEEERTVCVQPVEKAHGSFAEQQIRNLVHQVFSPGWPKPAKHVVFAAVDEYADVAGVCVRVAETLSSLVSGHVSILEAGFSPSKYSAAERETTPRRGKVNSWRNSSCQISDNLWRLSGELLLGDGKNAESPTWIRNRLAELRMDFDYTVLHAPPVGLSSEAALLGHLSDGLVLVLEANLTRRVAAQRAKEMIQAANARLLGTVLSGRTFPLPEAIYKRL
jgi:hypothetical protein